MIVCVDNIYIYIHTYIHTYIERERDIDRTIISWDHPAAWNILSWHHLPNSTQFGLTLLASSNLPTARHCPQPMRLAQRPRVAATKVPSPWWNGAAKSSWDPSPAWRGDRDSGRRERVIYICVHIYIYIIYIYIRIYIYILCIMITTTIITIMSTPD